MIQEIDLTGQRFGRLVAIERYKGDEKKDYTRWICKCDCGNEKPVARASLRSGETQSCGCLRKEGMSERQKTHGKSRTREYYSWKNMMQRCYDPKNIGYNNYGNRGITVCEEWHDFLCFLNDIGNAPEGYSIERINNDVGYCKENCKWATRLEQNLNTRQNVYITFNDKTQTISQWAKETGLSESCIAYRLKHWNCLSKILTTPVRKRKFN